MNRFTRLFAALLCVVAVSCGTSSSLVQRWSDTNFEGQPGQKMIVIALAKSERMQKTWEGAFSGILREVKVQPIAGSTVLPVQQAADEATLKQAVKETGADLAAVTRLISVDKETTYVPGSAYYTPAPAYYGFYGYYSSSYAMVSTPRVLPGRQGLQRRDQRVRREDRETGLERRDADDQPGNGPGRCDVHRRHDRRRHDRQQGDQDEVRGRALIHGNRRKRC